MWISKFLNQFEYTGPDDLDGKVDNLMNRVQMSIDRGISCLVVDNLTNFGNQIGTESWKVLADGMDKIIRVTKKNKIVTLFVLHTKSGAVNTPVTPKTLPIGVDKKGEKKDPWDIFKQSTTYVRRPTLSDIYGGGQALSQLSGAFIIWRPYQKMQDEYLQSMTAILLESFRHVRSVDIQYFFNGERFDFLSNVEQGKAIDATTPNVC
jgi:hypothetical protein